MSNEIIDSLIEFDDNIIKFIKETLNKMKEHDLYTYNHSLRVASYSRKISESLGLEKKECNIAYIGGLLHDVGKITISSKILSKETSLSAYEYEEIKKHTIKGYNYLLKHINNLTLANVALNHHERLDGSGYPCGLDGNKMSLLDKIVAVSDSFDAMTSERTYQKAISPQIAIGKLKESKDKYDIKIIEHLINVEER